MPLVIFISMVIVIVLDWFQIVRGNNRFRYITKPLSVALIIVFFLLQIDSLEYPVWIFLLGLLFGLGGDIFLMFESDHWFLTGLVSFLLGHIAYIIGFFSTGMVRPLWLALLFFVPVAVLIVMILRPLLKATEKQMRSALLAYGIVIGSMLFSALCLLANDAWDSTATILAIAGAGLFVTSDALLASWKFLEKNNELWPMVTYHLAQLAIAASVIVQFRS